MVRRCTQTFVLMVIPYLLVIALISPVGAGVTMNAPTQQHLDQPQLSDQLEAQADQRPRAEQDQEKKKRRKLGCELLENKAADKKAAADENEAKDENDEPSGDTTCVTMEVEAWYHTVASSSDVPPIAGAPAFSPYAEKTMHIGATSGREDSRTYVTLDLVDLPLGATINGGVLVLTLNEAETRTPETVQMEACSVIEPPENNQEGSFDTPPEHDCSARSEAVLKKKPRPFFTVDLEPFATSLTSGADGLVLLPTERTSEEGASWHVGLYAKNNASEDAVAIAAALEYEVIDLTGPGQFDPVAGAIDPPGGDEADLGSSGFDPSAFGSSDAPSFGGSPDLGDIGLPDTASATEPVDVGAQAAAPVALVVPRYAAIWYLPIVLMAGVALVGSVLTRKIEIRP